MVMIMPLPDRRQRAKNRALGLALVALAALFFLITIARWHS
jgi:hypothetical protein